jgi:protein SCO1/2
VTRRDRTGLIVLAVAAAFCTAILIAIAIRVERSDDQGPGGSPTSGDPWNELPATVRALPTPRIRLRDQDGRLVDTRGMKGKALAITFVYTRCPDVCPLIGSEIADALRQLGPRLRDVRVLAVSVDPAGDSPDAARRWLNRLGLTSRTHYLLGDERALEPIWRSYYVAPQIRGRPETSTHSATIWLVGRDGRPRGTFAAGAPVSPDDIARALRLLAVERT